MERALGLTVSLGVLAAALTPGCVENLGPLKVEVSDFQLLDEHNVSFNVSYTNTGEKPLTRIDATFSPRIRGLDGTYKDGHGNIANQPYRYRPSFFAPGEVIAPGEVRNFTVRSENWTGLEPGDLYEVAVWVEAQDDTTRWSWVRTLCWTTEGKPHVDDWCGRTLNTGIEDPEP